MASHSDESRHVTSLSEFEKDEKCKEQIIAAICAMLNSNGGKVVIKFDDSNPDHQNLDPQISAVARKLDQSMISIIGVEEASKITFKNDAGSLTVSVKRADSLITTNYNLYSPSQTQVVKMPSTKPPKDLKDNVINIKAVVPEPVQLGTHCRTFYKDKKCGFDESTICQLKNLKDEQSKRTTLADRMIGKGNKLSCYVSAFATHNGGHIYFGIRDDNKVVEGERVPNEKSKRNIIGKVQNAFNKMTWPEQISRQPKRGKQWEIFFEPVLDENSVPVALTFVIVIYIAPCPGGVFTDVPECYEMVNGKVSKMSFATWKKRILQPVWLRKSQSEKEIPQSVQLITWSSDVVRKAFTIDCDELRKIVSNGNWEIFEEECSSLQNESDLRETMDLLIWFKQITACNRTGEFIEAHKLLKDYKALSSQVEDCYIFEVLGLYLEAALKRASGDLKALKGLLTEALSKAEHIEPGLVTATVYTFAATVSDLKNLDCDLDSSAVLAERALEHLECVPDSSDVLAAMRRKANIILATFHLGCNVSGQLIMDSIDILSLREAKACIKAIYESAYEEHPLSVYFDIQLNLVLSIYKYRHSQLDPDQKNQDLRDACSYTKKAKSLAVKYGFTEMVEWSENNEALCKQELKHVGHVNCSDHLRSGESDQKSAERKDEHEYTGRADCVEEREGIDHSERSKQRCDSLNPTQQVGLQDGKGQDNSLESRKSVKNMESQKGNDGRPNSTSRSRDIVEKAKSQVMCSKSQNPDGPNVEKDSQVKPKSEGALFCAVMERTSNTVRGSKAQDSSDKQAQPQRDSASVSGQRNQDSSPPGQSDLSKYVDAEPFQPRTSCPSGTATHHLYPNVSLGAAQPETSACVINNDVMPMHVPRSAFEGSVSSSGYTGISPLARFSHSSFSFDQCPASLFQVPVQQLPPPTYPFESTHRALVPNYSVATYVAYQPEALVNHPRPMMMRPWMAAGRGARFSFEMPEPRQKSPRQRFSRKQHRNYLTSNSKRS